MTMIVLCPGLSAYQQDNQSGEEGHGEMLGIKAEMQGEGQNITLVSGSVRCGTLQCAVFDFLMS